MIRTRGQYDKALSIQDILQVQIEREKQRKVIQLEDLRHLKGPENKINILSLFSGCGGLDLGFELAGLVAVIGEKEAMQAFAQRTLYDQVRRESIFHTLYTNDVFPEANASYRANFPQTVQHATDIRKVRNFPKADLVIGGFPCPGYSLGSGRFLDDERNFLYIHFIRAIIQSQPALFVAENVKGMLSLGKGEVMRQIAEDFASCGYDVQYKLLSAEAYGVPQVRERVFIIGVKKGITFNYNYPAPTHGAGLQPVVTLQDAIGDLAAAPGPYYTGGYSSIYMSRNRKKRWDEPSFTIQASGRQAPLHPGGLPMVKVGKDAWQFAGEEENRRLSVKEIARIQTFPDWYTFSDGGNLAVQENNRLDKQYKQIGNAVPVLLAKAVATPIAEWAVGYLQEREAQSTQQLMLF